MVVAGVVIYAKADGDDVYKRMFAGRGIAFKVISNFEYEFIGATHQFSLGNDWIVGSAIIVRHSGNNVRSCINEWSENLVRP